MATLSKWDDVTVWGIEQFGLPGDRYVTDMSADYMTWFFRDPKDALLFKLRFSEVIA